MGEGQESRENAVLVGRAAGLVRPLEITPGQRAVGRGLARPDDEVLRVARVAGRWRGVGQALGVPCRQFRLPQLGVENRRRPPKRVNRLAKRAIVMAAVKRSSNVARLAASNCRNCRWPRLDGGGAASSARIPAMKAGGSAVRSANSRSISAWSTLSKSSPRCSAASTAAPPRRRCTPSRTTAQRFMAQVTPRRAGSGSRGRAGGSTSVLCMCSGAWASCASGRLSMRGRPMGRVAAS